MAYEYAMLVLGVVIIQQQVDQGGGGLLHGRGRAEPQRRHK